MTVLTGRAVSPVFVGREDELGILSEAYETARAGTARAVLLGGEAGVGKTRLVNEFAASVYGAGGRVLAGGCLELSAAGLPYAPFTAALRELVREIGADGLAAIMPDGTTRDLARLLPGLGDLPTERDPDTSRVRLFEQMLTLLGRLAGGHPLFLLIEDAHWADRSSRDLLSFLVRNLRDERVLLVVTYRSDDLHRTHPLRPLLAELHRAGSVTRVELPRLSHGQVAGQLGGILGRPADPGLVERVYQRSAGNPLFVEATAATAGDGSGPVPESLRDLLLAAVQRLPEETQDLLRVASAADIVGHELLTVVSGLGDAALSRALRPAVDANVLVPDGEAYVFRHALIREAVHDDLLPGEHTRLHRQYAEALTGHPELTVRSSAAVATAQHWHHAHVTDRALSAAWEAAAESGASLAYAEQVQMLERVLELWDQVENAADLVGRDHVRVLEMAGEAAAACGEIDRGLAFARAGISELDEAAEPGRVATLLALRSKLRKWRGLPGEMGDLLRAERLVPEPSPTRASVLLRLCSLALISASPEVCRAYGEEAVQIALAHDDADTAADAEITLATVGAEEGEGDIAPLLALLGRLNGTADEWLRLRAMINVSHCHEGAGNHVEAIAVARQGLELARRIGRGRSQGGMAGCNLVESLISLGEWDEAAATAERLLELNPAPAVLTSLQIFRAQVALGRGEPGAADLVPATPPRHSDEETAPAQDILPLLALRIDARLSAGDHTGALDAVDEALGARTLELKPRYLWAVLLAAAAACADIATDPALVRSPAPVHRAAELLRTLRTIAARTSARGAVSAASAVTFAAESARADGVLDRQAWDGAAAAWADLEQPHPRAVALARAAEAAVAEGDRVGAAARIRTATELADRLGARPLADRIADLSRRARLTATPPAGDGHGLTPREREVLRLVAAGRTNREIAEALFISAKTASVHVSNIIAKLGVTTRTEAAAQAHRSGLT